MSVLQDYDLNDMLNMGVNKPSVNFLNKNQVSKANYIPPAAIIPEPEKQETYNIGFYPLTENLTKKQYQNNKIYGTLFLILLGILIIAFIIMLVLWCINPQNIVGNGLPPPPAPYVPPTSSTTDEPRKTRSVFNHILLANIDPNYSSNDKVDDYELVKENNLLVYHNSQYQKINQLPDIIYYSPAIYPQGAQIFAKDYSDLTIANKTLVIPHGTSFIQAIKNMSFRLSPGQEITVISDCQIRSDTPERITISTNNHSYRLSQRITNLEVSSNTQIKIDF